MSRGRRRAVIAGVLVLIIGATSLTFGIRRAQAVTIGDILKIGGIVLVVSTFGDRINTFINSALSQNRAEAVGATKVVPIFSVGRGTYVGAAQVVGLPANVRQTQGVAALNLKVGNLEGSALLPMTTRRPGTTISRVGGVGIGAVIDFRI